VFLAVLALGTPAQAGAWEEFERRCLVPMENVEEPDVEGLKLTLKTDPKVDPSLTLTFAHFDEDALAEDDFFMFLIRDARGATSECQIIIKSPDIDKLTSRIELWRRAVGVSYRLLSSTDELVEVWHSTHWREPVLSVAFGQTIQIDGFALIARETDLES
jgi:hypothetical protein